MGFESEWNLPNWKYADQYPQNNTYRRELVADTKIDVSTKIQPSIWRWEFLRRDEMRNIERFGPPIRKMV